ncbi:hypothetical protein GOODEAATRI_023083, partial [Goodea atripinnis]
GEWEACCFKPLDPPHMASPPQTRLTESASSREVGGHMEVMWRSHLRENLDFWDQGLQRTPGVAVRAMEMVWGA